MIKRPERIKIISKRFTVNYVPEGTEDLSEDKMGLCDTMNQLIWIEEGLKYDTQKETLLHETLHAISDEMNLDLSEVQVSGAAKGILAMLIDNPSFAKFLLKKEKNASNI
jgi:hypothetical protein